MSLLRRTDLYSTQGSDRKGNDYGFIIAIALLFIALALVVVSSISPLSFGGGISSGVPLVGP